MMNLGYKVEEESNRLYYTHRHIRFYTAPHTVIGEYEPRGLWAGTDSYCTLWGFPSTIVSTSYHYDILISLPSPSIDTKKIVTMLSKH